MTIVSMIKIVTICVVLFVCASLILACNKKPKVAQDTEVEPEVEIEIDNYLVGTRWAVFHLFCLSDDVESYNLKRVTPERGFSYGNWLSFVDSTNFMSGYSAPCGNDCFTTVYGKYKLIEDEKIVVSVDSVTYDGDCAAPTEYREKKKTIFNIKQDGDTLIFSK